MYVGLSSLCIDVLWIILLIMKCHLSPFSTSALQIHFGKVILLDNFLLFVFMRVTFRDFVSVRTSTLNFHEYDFNVVVSLLEISYFKHLFSIDRVFLLKPFLRSAIAGRILSFVSQLFSSMISFSNALSSLPSSHLFASRNGCCSISPPTFKVHVSVSCGKHLLLLHLFLVPLHASL